MCLTKRLFFILLITVLASTAWADPPVWQSSFGTALGQSDDDCDQVPVGFTFNFYGNPSTNVWVNSNGNMTFSACFTSWSSPDIPEGPWDLIGALYGDFNPAVFGDAYYNTLGTAPFRTFVATWNVVPEFSDLGPFYNTFQATLYESSDAILFGYNGLTTDGFNWNGPSMDVGITSGTGLFINSASGAAIPALDQTNICYLPDGAGDYVELAGPCEIEVAIDIKFCSDPNAFNCKKNGVLPVTIFGNDLLDGTGIDPSTLQLCLADLSVCVGGPKDYSIADRGTPPGDLGAAQCAIDPATGLELDWLNQDGIMDIDAAFYAADVQTMLATFCSGPKDGISPDLVIVGSTFDGIPIFSTPVGNAGIDQLVKKNK